MPEQLKEVITAISSWMIFALFGALGGVANYLHLISGDKRRFSWFAMVSGMLVGGFLGLLFGSLAMHYAMDATLQHFVSGASGAMGWTTIDTLRWIARQRLKISLEKKDGL